VDWKQYEEEIYQHFITTFPSAQVTQDTQVLGRYSQVERQIDVLIEGTIAGFHLRIVVDAKHRNKRIDVTDVEAFIGYCADIGASKGVLISLNGYTPAAASRAHHDDSEWTSPAFVDIFQLPVRSCSNASGLSWSR
jgi:GNAT superfamily N-acetyltransferase